MKKIFRGQVILSAVYTVTAIVVFLYTLVFMTEYNDLFGPVSYTHLTLPTIA